MNLPDSGNSISGGHKEPVRQEHPAGSQVEVMRVWSGEPTVGLERNYDIMKEEIINRTC